MKKIALTFISSLLGGCLYAAALPAASPQSPVEGEETALSEEEGAASKEEGAKVRIPETAEEIMFGVRLPEKLTGSEEGKTKLKNKIEQILGRCGAGAGGSGGVFIIEPVINETDRSTSEGLVRNVSSISGELSLTARHRYSDAIFYSAAVPLNAVATGKDVDPLLLLVKAIKPTDAAYVRFVRNARKHAFDYGVTHPEIYDVPDAAPDTVVVLLPVAVVPAAPAAPAAPAPAPVASTPAAPEAPAAAVPQPAQQCEFYFSRTGWEVALKSCEYDPSTRAIHFVLSVTCKIRDNMNNTYTAITRAIASDGLKYDKFGIDDYHHDFPYGVPVIVQGSIKDVYSNPGSVPFIEMRLGNTDMEIRNLTVKNK